jgi:hypothetical protein
MALLNRDHGRCLRKSIWKMKDVVSLNLDGVPNTSSEERITQDIYVLYNLK